MGLLSRLFNRRRFVSVEDFQENLSKQTTESLGALQELRDIGIDENRRLRLDFSFTTDSLSKSLTLAQMLQQQQCTVEAGQPEGQDMFSVSGRSPGVLMVAADLQSWVTMMCKLGYANDCDFEGWSVNPEQY